MFASKSNCKNSSIFSHRSVRKRELCRKGFSLSFVSLNSLPGIMSSPTRTTGFRFPPIPIRVHTGPQRRGRKLSDRSRTLLHAAVREFQEKRRAGVPVSMRDIADRYNVPKSTLHRYVRKCTLPAPAGSSSRSKKHEVNFLLS